MAKGKPRLSTKTSDAEDTNAMLVEGVHDALIRMFRSPKLSNERFIVARIAVDSVVTEEGGAEFAKYSLRHIEFTDEDALLAAYEDRTGNSALPGDDSANQLPGLSEKDRIQDAAFLAAAPATKAEEPPTE